MFIFPFELSPKNDDEHFMAEALKEAWKAFIAGEVPIGAVLVYEGKIVCRAHNQVEQLKDATAHAEMLCLSAVGSEIFNDWRLTDATLYSTLEPCSMCAGAMQLCRIKTLVWGAPDLRCGANGSLLDLFETPHPFHQLEIRHGVYQKESSHLMQEFFKKRREN